MKNRSRHMRSLFFALALLFFSNVYSQTPNWIWAKSSMGSGVGQKTGNCVSTDLLGNVYVTGSFSTPTITFGVITLSNNSNVGGSDIFIVKYNTSGTEVWAKNIGSESDEAGEAIIADNFGNVYITGYFFSDSISFGATILANQGPTTGWLQSQEFLAKYDTAGNFLWAKTSSLAFTDEAGGTCLATDAAGNVYQSGFFWSPTLAFGTTTLVNADPTGNSDDLFLAKYDSSGNALWAKRAGGEYKDICYSITTDISGSLYLTGKSQSTTLNFGSIIVTNPGIQAAFIGKYDVVTGNEIWAKAYGGTNIDFGKDVSTDSSGNVYLTGYFFSSIINFDSIALTNSDTSKSKLFLVKLNTAGNILWAKTAVGVGTGGLNVCVNNFNSIMMTGYFTDTITMGTNTFVSGHNVNNIGYNSIFVAQFDTSGNVMWAESVGGFGDSFCKSIAIDLTGNLYATGSFASSSIAFGSSTLNNSGAGQGSAEMFIAKLNDRIPTVINFHSAPDEDISIYPNPTISSISIEVKNNKSNLSICIHDMMGKIVISPFQIYAEKTALDISNLAKGNYILIIKDMYSGEQQARQIVKEH